nr:hypothetical protein [Tanacetum cinerariifolium]
MAVYLSKSDASEGFNQIIDFLDGSSIEYPLTVNPNIYVSCIKQFWTTVAVKKVNDVIRLQALVDKKKVVVIEDTIRKALCLDDAEGVECLANEEIFVELARIGYEKPSTKLTKQVGDLSTHTTKYTSPDLTQKVFANMQRVGKGFSGVETPLFAGMLVEQQVVEEVDANEIDDNVNAGDTAKGDVSAVHGEVHTVQPPSPQPQPQPQQDVGIPMNLLQKVLDTYTALTRRVEHLEFDKRVETSDETMLDDVSNQGRMIVEMDQDVDVVLEGNKEVANDVKDDQDDVTDSAQDQGRKVKSQAEIYKIDLEHANKVLSMQEDESEPAEVQEVVDIVTTANIITEVVTIASETITAASINIIVAEAQVPAATLTATPARADLNKNFDRDKAINHVKKKAKEDPVVKRYQVLKRNPQTKAQARKNLMVYLKNVASFKMNYFKGMSYDDIRPIFKAKFNTNMAFLLKTKEQIEEEESRALKRLNETPAKKAAKRQKLDEEIIKLNNKPYYKIIRADDTHQLYVSFLSLLRNFDKEDLEALCSLVKVIFSTTKPKKFSDDFLLDTLGAMFEKPEIHAQIWKNQRSVHGPVKVKGWKLLESCSV